MEENADASGADLDSSFVTDIFGKAGLGHLINTPQNNNKSRIRTVTSPTPGGGEMAVLGFHPSNF